MSDHIPHKLMGQLMSANVSEVEIAELFEDLKYIFDNPFDCAINEAITLRGSTYVEVGNNLPN